MKYGIKLGSELVLFRESSKDDIIIYLYDELIEKKRVKPRTIGELISYIADEAYYDCRMQVALKNSVRDYWIIQREIFEKND